MSICYRLSSSITSLDSSPRSQVSTMDSGEKAPAGLEQVNEAVTDTA